MKKLTATVLAALLLLAGCAKDDADTDTTTATTTETTVTTETTAEVTEEEISFYDEEKNIPVYESTLDVSDSKNNVFARVCSEKDVPSKYVVRFSDALNLALVCETFEQKDAGNTEYHSKITAVYFNGYRYEKDIFLLGGTAVTLEYTPDVLAVVEKGGSMPGNGVLICKNGVKEITDFCLFPKAVDGEMTYRLMTTEGCWLDISAGAVLQMDGEDIYEITGTVKVTDEGIVMDEFARLTMNDLFRSEEWRQVREENGLESFEEYKEYVRNKLDNDYTEEFNKE